jgi:murein DD-endopeptidase MepM/ murein hydrolase activator NlpD/uncharacterized protein YkwD
LKRSALILLLPAALLWHAMPVEAQTSKNRSRLPSRSGKEMRRSQDPTVVVPIIFPVIGKVSWTDTFGAPRGGGRRSHLGQDLMAPKMTPVVAAFDGVVVVRRSSGVGGHNMLTLQGDNGWTAEYMHLNNDTPGTDDGMGTAEYAFVAGLKSGDRVIAGQMLGWVGDSGNAEDSGAHLHFELWGPEGVINAAPSLRAATVLPTPRVNLSAPDLKPQPGEVRLDGCVRSVDTAQGLLVVDLVARTTPDGKSRAITKPQRASITIREAAVLRRDDPAQTLADEDLTPGLAVTVLGKEGGEGRSMQARVAAVAKPVEVAVLPPLSTVPAPPTDEPTETPAPPAPAPNLPAAPPAAAQTPAPAASSQLQKLQRRAVELINEHRRKQGLPEVALDDRLSEAAMRHCQDMAARNFIKNIGSDGSQPEERVKAAGYTASRVAQLYVIGTFFPEDVVESLILHSREGNRQLLDRRLTEVGVGYVLRPEGKFGREQYFWVLVLAEPQR